MITSALILGLSACSSDQNNEPGVGEEAPPSAVESTPDTGEAAETDTDQDSGDDEGAPTPTSEGVDAAEEQNTDIAPPVSFDIPAIDAGSELLHLGLRENNTLEVPPGDPGSPASWYTGSPVPGEQGPAVLLGHVDDSAGNPGVFYDLPDLVEGDEITVNQEDGDTATFIVTKAEQYGKDTFPTLDVYGNTDEPELRLITCDGYNQASGEYEDNYVVYATLAS